MVRANLAGDRAEARKPPESQIRKGRGCLDSFAPHNLSTLVAGALVRVRPLVALARALGEQTIGHPQPGGKR